MQGLNRHSKKLTRILRPDFYDIFLLFWILLISTLFIVHFSAVFQFQDLLLNFLFSLKIGISVIFKSSTVNDLYLEKIQFSDQFCFNKHFQPKSSDFRAVSSKTVSEHNVFCQPFFVIQPISMLIFKNAHFLNTTDYSFQNSIFQASDL